jgi:hypothetical protein
MKPLYDLFRDKPKPVMMAWLEHFLRFQCKAKPQFPLPRSFSRYMIAVGRWPKGKHENEYMSYSCKCARLNPFYMTG